MKYIILCCLLCCISVCEGQKKDSVIKVDDNYITLSEIVVNNKLDVFSFIQRIKNDTTFYKAFRNLHILGYTALNDIRMLDKNGNSQATLSSKTRQVRENNCRKMEVLQELVAGLSYKMIAEKLHISFETVRSHIKKVYEKLHVHNNAEAVAKTLKGGFLK